MSKEQLIVALRSITATHALTHKQREALAWAVAKLYKEQDYD